MTKHLPSDGSRGFPRAASLRPGDLVAAHPQSCTQPRCRKAVTYGRIVGGVERSGGYCLHGHAFGAGCPHHVEAAPSPRKHGSG